MRKNLLLLCVTVSLPASLMADFSYEQSTKMTGGAMMGMMRVAGAFSKTLREPMVATVAVKGNRLVHGSKDNASVIDLDSETITAIDYQKKTYSVMTFEEMAKMMEQAMQQVNKGKSGEPAPEFTVSVKSTGASRQIAGYDAKEMVMTMLMEGTDQKTGDKGGMLITTNIWIVPRVSGYAEISEFYKKMGAKLAWTPGGGGMMAGRPDLARGMANVYKEAAKLDGMPVLQVMKMNASADGQAVTGAAGAEAQPAGQQASQQASQQTRPKAEAPSIGGALAGLGGFGGFGRKKKQQEAPKQETAQAAPEPAGDPSTLMEMTTESSGFSSAAVDPAKFAVPAGFKKVENEALKRNR